MRKSWKWFSLHLIGNLGRRSCTNWTLIWVHVLSLNITLMGWKGKESTYLHFFIPVLLHILQNRHRISWRRLAKTFDDLVRQKRTSVWPSPQLLTVYTTFNTTLIVFYSICDGRGDFQEARRFEDGWSVEGTSNCHCGSYIGDKAFVLYPIFTTAKTNCRPRGVRVRPTSFL